MIPLAQGPGVAARLHRLAGWRGQARAVLDFVLPAALYQGGTARSGADRNSWRRSGRHDE
ncbi:MAG: hypothetical protein H9533_21115 [Rhodobacteraceae bacterium]|nr:hypothetical protein [Paracoccaceae bacterium]